MDISTIGYERLPPSDFLAILKQEGVTHLIDVRAIANSRRPGYAKRALSAALEQAGIGYLHVPALGTPKEGREAVRSGHPALMQRIFAAHLATPPAQEALVSLAETARRGRCCLLCLEADPAHCHRTIVAAALHQRWGFAVRHLPAPDQ